MRASFDGIRAGVRGGAATLALAMTALASGATVIYVDDDAAPAGDGATWATAYDHLQDALDAASGVDGPCEIRVAEGRYRPDRSTTSPIGSGDRDATFMLSTGDELRGGYAGVGAVDPDERDPSIFATILDGDLLGDDDPDPIGSGFAGYTDNSHHVVTMLEQTELDGVTVRGGNANGIAADGAGILTDFYGVVTLIDCDVRLNRADGAGAGLAYRGDEAIILGSSFTDNHAARGAAIGQLGFGPGTVEACRFERNTASGDGGAIATEIYTRWTILDSVFRENVAGARGGALLAGFEGTTDLIGCILRANEADDGGAIYNHAQLPMTLTNCDITGNRAVTRGGGISLIDSFIDILNCTIVGNEADAGGGVFVMDFSYVDDFYMANSIAWANRSLSGFGEQIALGERPDYGSTGHTNITVDHSVLEGDLAAIDVEPFIWSYSIGGTSVMDVDPGLEDGASASLAAWAVADVRLATDSPAIDAGSNALVPADANDLDGDGDTVEPMPYDLDGAARVVNATGAGVGRVDLGAYEHPAATVCLGDLDGSGRVGFADLVTLITLWGPCPGCAADQDDDDFVGFEDLMIVLKNWGECG